MAADRAVQCATTIDITTRGARAPDDTPLCREVLTVEIMRILVSCLGDLLFALADLMNILVIMPDF